MATSIDLRTAQADPPIQLRGRLVVQRQDLVPGRAIAELSAGADLGPRLLQALKQQPCGLDVEDTLASRTTRAVQTPPFTLLGSASTTWPFCTSWSCWKSCLPVAVTSTRTVLDRSRFSTSPTSLPSTVSVRSGPFVTWQRPTLTASNHFATDHWPGTFA
jgi:hypothetical protein